MPLDPNFVQMIDNVDRHIRLLMVTSLNHDQADSYAHQQAVARLLAARLADTVGGTPTPVRLSRPRPNYVPHHYALGTGPGGVANWHAPLTEFERRAGVVDPDVPAVDATVVIDRVLGEPATAAVSNRYRSYCAEPLTPGPGICRLPIMRSMSDGKWFHRTSLSGQAVGPHPARYRNDCHECPPSDPFWSSSRAHLHTHLSEKHDVPEPIIEQLRAEPIKGWHTGETA